MNVMRNTEKIEQDPAPHPCEKANESSWLHRASIISNTLLSNYCTQII